MSQEKVDEKKNNRQHRKSLVRKKKLEYALSISAITLVAVAFVIWIGFSVYTKVEDNASENTEYVYHEVSTDAIQNYVSSLSE